MPAKPVESMLAGEAEDRKGPERIRWRCRRGMLELDLVLGRFVETHYARLDSAQRAAFGILLDAPDTELWNMIAGGGQAPESCRALLELLKTA